MAYSLTIYRVRGPRGERHLRALSAAAYDFVRALGAQKAQGTAPPVEVFDGETRMTLQRVNARAVEAHLRVGRKLKAEACEIEAIPVD